MLHLWNVHVMKNKRDELTPKAASRVRQKAHPDRCAEVPAAIRFALYVALQTKGSVALPSPYLKMSSSGEREAQVMWQCTHSTYASVLSDL